MTVARLTSYASWPHLCHNANAATDDCRLSLRTTHATKPRGDQHAARQTL